MSVSQETLKIAEDIIKQAEDLKLEVYQDTAVKRNETIGYGHKLKPNQKFLTKITKQQADDMFKKDLQIAVNAAINALGAQNFKKLSPQRQAVVIDLAFNMGQEGVTKFKKMITALNERNFTLASFQLGESSYRTQTKSRAYRNIYMMKEGKILTKQQGVQKALNDGLLTKDKNGKILYSKQPKDPNLNKLFSNESMHGKPNDAEVAKQIDNIKNTNIGGVSFDIDPVTTRLNGFVFDEKFTKVIQASIYDPSNYSLNDLIMPLKVMYDPEIKSKNVSVSLDPLVPTQPDGPWYKKVFYPLDMGNTNYGEDMIQADYLMKQLSLGVDENNKPFQYPQKLKQIGLDVQSIFRTVKHKTYEGSRTRLWIVIKDYQVYANDHFFEIKNVKMGVELKALQVSQNGSLKDCNDDPSPIAKRFSQIFTQHYDEIAEIYPILNKMKRLAKASIIAKLMYFKRIPIDLNLINKLYKKQKTQYIENMPRLQNKLKKQQSDKIIQMQVFGGCSFDISNISSKLMQLQKQVKEAKQIFQKKNLNSNILPLSFKQEDKENIGNYFFIKNEKHQLQNKKLYPFIFQQLVKCKHENCNKVCNLDYYSVTNKQCINHSSMKCSICKQLILPGQTFKTNAQKIIKFHQKCFKCSTCQKNIEGEFAKINDKQYHKECIPKVSVGQCQECKKQIYQNEQYAQNPQNMKKYHSQCAALVNKRIMDSIPTCKLCNVKLQGQYVKYQGQPYHEECAKKKAGIK